MAGDFVFLLLILYCQHGISKSFCLEFGWSPEWKTEAPYLSFYLESAALACSFRWIGEPTQLWGLLSKLYITHTVFVLTASECEESVGLVF